MELPSKKPMPVLDRFSKHKKVTDIPNSVDEAIATQFNDIEDRLRGELKQVLTEEMIGKMIARNVAIDIAVKVRK